MASITPVPETPSRTVNEYTESEHRVFLLGENRWEDSSRLTNKNNMNSKGVLTSKCITCNGEGHLLCEGALFLLQYKLSRAIFVFLTTKIRTFTSFTTKEIVSQGPTFLGWTKICHLY